MPPFITYPNDNVQFFCPVERASGRAGGGRLKDDLKIAARRANNSMTGGPELRVKKCPALRYPGQIA
jgi:hypothetical protein